jgi:two-component system OmpR family sensor kinase
VVAVGLSVLGLGTAWALGTLLDREIDASVLNIASIQAASLADGPGGQMHFHEWELTPEEAVSVRDLVQYAQVWDASGSSLLRSQYMTSDLPVDADALARASAGELIWARQNFEGTQVRTLFYPLARLGAAHEAHVLQVAAPLTQRDAILFRATVFFCLLTVLMTTATYAGAGWLAGSAVQPIHAVIDQAEEIGAGSLDRRINAFADTTEYRRLVEVLNTMLTRIHGAFEAQRRFAADASHELRSPLTVMRGEIEVALRRPRSEGEYVEVLESTLEEAVRLSRISEDLLALARSDAGTLEPRAEVVDVVDEARRIVERLRAKAEERGISIDSRAEGGGSATVDAAVLGQILWNLTDNALEHAPDGGNVLVQISTDDLAVTVTVTDDGPGIGDVDPDLLFERFYRGDRARTPSGGAASTGLGLAIVRALARAHGGSVHAEDRPGGGALFTAVLRQIPVSPHRTEEGAHRARPRA